MGIDILHLPQALGLTGTEQIETVQGNASVRVAVSAIAALGLGPTGPVGPTGPTGPPGIPLPGTAFVPASAGSLGIQAAYNSFIGTAGGVIYLGPGVFLVGPVPITPVDLVVLQGAGMGVSIIQQTVLGVRAFNLAGSLGTSNYLSFQDFTVNGMWLANQSLGGDNDRAFAINGVNRLQWSNVEATYCRQMSFTAAFCGEVIVQDCRVRWSARDAINLTGSQHCIVTDNVITHCGDDAIAIHQTASTGNPPNEGHIVTGNIIEDSYGIKMLGGSKCTITSNTLRRVKGYGIYTEPGGVEGYSDQIAIDVTGNTITDIINANVFGASVIQVGIYVGNAAKLFKPPVVGGATPVYTLPENFYYLSNSATAQNAGLQGLNITGNNIYGFTLPPLNAYSTWGFGLAFTSTGFIDPNMSSGFKYGAQGIRVDGAFLQANISGNNIVGVVSGIVADATMNILDQLRISGNTVARFAQYGVGFETASQLYGRIFIDSNTFDADPYFEHANRTAPIDGTWNTSQFQPCAFDCVKFLGFTARGNVFRNLCRVTHTSGTGSISYEGNTYYMQPASTATVAAPAAANRGIWTPDGIGHNSDRIVWEDSNPTSTTYGQELGRTIGQSSALPANVYHIAGQFVRSSSFVQTGSPAYTVIGWQALTTGNANVLNTDWREMRCLTGN